MSVVIQEILHKVEEKKPLNEKIEATSDWLIQARNDEPKEVSKIKERSGNAMDRYNKLLKDLQNRERKLIVIQKEMSTSEELIEPLEQVFSQVELLVEAAPPVSFEADEVEAHLEKIKVIYYFICIIYFMYYYITTVGYANVHQTLCIISFEG